jgi:hypothetical protein
MPVPFGECIGRRQASPRCSETPWELRVSRRSAGSRADRPWGAAHRARVRPCAWRKAREGKRARTARSASDGPGITCSGGEPWRPGTTAVGPGRKEASRLEAAERSTSCSSELAGPGASQVRDGGGRGDASRSDRSKGRRQGENPRSGSGLSQTARPEREEPVEGVRNPEDGTCRVRQTRDERTSRPSSLVGHAPRGGPPGHRAGHDRRARPLRGRRSLREPPRTFGSRGRPDCGRPRDRRDGEEGAANR